MKFSEVTLPSNRKFGFFFTVIFLVIGTYIFSGTQVIISYVLFALSAIFLLVTLVNAEFLLPFNKLWMRLGLLIGLIVSPVVMGVIFFGLFAPISLLMKLFGRDELRLKMKSRQSYWKERNTDVSQSDTFKHQY
jgi:hypothetical protein